MLRLLVENNIAQLMRMPKEKYCTAITNSEFKSLKVNINVNNITENFSRIEFIRITKRTIVPI